MQKSSVFRSPCVPAHDEDYATLISMKKTRRAGATETFSVSVDRETKRRLKALARARHRGNVSALITELSVEGERQAAFDHAWKWYGGPEPTPEEAAPDAGGMTTSGLTFDTGMLIALERRRQRAWHVYRTAMNAKVRITVPTVVIAEWWRGRTDAREHVRSALLIEALSESLSRLAGEALVRIASAATVDAIVMASAASRGDVVYTSDFEDLKRLSPSFPSVRLLSV